MTTEPPPALPADHQLREQLSSLMDGEDGSAERNACIERLCADPRAREDWAAWHFAADALRSSEVAAWHSKTFVTRVAAVLAAEPYVLAPRSRLRPPRFARRVVLPGAAIAAAAAVLAVVAVPQLRGDAPAQTQQATRPDAASKPVATAEGDILRAAELELFLSAHRELSAGAVMPRSAPYLRTAVQARGTQR
jgi:negative regulator of sigma E activity